MTEMEEETRSATTQSQSRPAERGAMVNVAAARWSFVRNQDMKVAS